MRYSERELYDDVVYALYEIKKEKKIINIRYRNIAETYHYQVNFQHGFFRTETKLSENK